MKSLSLMDGVVKTNGAAYITVLDSSGVIAGVDRPLKLHEWHSQP